MKFPYSEGGVFHNLLLAGTISWSDGKWLYDFPFVVGIGRIAHPSFWNETHGVAEIGFRCVGAIVVNCNNSLEGIC